MTDPHVICTCGHERQEHNEGGCGVLVGSWSDGMCPCREFAAGDGGENEPHDFVPLNTLYQPIGRLYRGIAADICATCSRRKAEHSARSASESSDG